VRKVEGEREERREGEVKEGEKVRRREGYS
jgi:hypothetical protein